MLLATRDPGWARAVAAAVRPLDLKPEVACADLRVIDERFAAVALDGFPTPSTLRAMADAITRNPALAILVRGPVVPDVEPLVALASGAGGYVPAETPAEQVADAVRTLLDGEPVLPGSIAAALVRGLRCGGRGMLLHRPDGTPTVLTHREWEVLVLLRQGRSTAEIATQFVVAQGTVRTHAATIVRKLGADGRASLAMSG